MPDAPITASNLISAGWRRADGAEDCFRFPLGALLEVRVTCTVIGWKPEVVACGLHSPHRTVFGMAELHRLVDETRAANEKGRVR